MNKYQKGKIYRLVCNNTGLNYYGSTTQLLSKRLYAHKLCYKNYLNDNKNYFTSFKIIEGNNFEIILVELFNCSCKIELEKRERYYIENNDCVNKNIPTRTIKEWRELHKNDYKEYNKDYYKEHKDEKKNKLKEYYDLNKDKIKEQKKEFYNLNKDKINEKRKKKYELDKAIKNKE
jgi:hypothetical protein